jgi:hypothetical protein
MEVFDDMRRFEEVVRGYRVGCICDPSVVLMPCVP